MTPTSTGLDMSLALGLTQPYNSKVSDNLSTSLQIGLPDVIKYKHVHPGPTQTIYISHLFYN